MSSILSTGVTTLVDTALETVANVGAGATTFIPVVSARGPLDPTPVSNIAAYTSLYGGRHTGHEASYDYVEALTAGSGTAARVVCVRVIGPAAKTATLAVQDSDSTTIATVTAANPGAWGNRVELELKTAATVQTLSVYDAGRLVHQWTVTDADSIAAAALQSPILAVTVADGKGKSKPKDLAKTALSGGADDDSAITMEHLSAALAKADRSLGGGQVIAPMWQTSEAHRVLIDHAEATNRVALLDAPYTAKVDDAKISEWAQLRTQVAAHFANGQDVSWRAALFPMWVQLRPWGTGAGIARAVPGSVFAAAVIANNADKITPNEQPIETNGIAAGTIFDRPVVPMDLGQIDQVSQQTQANLPFHDYNGLRLFGFASVSNSPAWQQFNRGRFACQLKAEVTDRTRFIIGRLDNEANRTELHDMIAGCVQDHITAGNLEPLTPDNDFAITVGKDPAQSSRITVTLEVRFAFAIQAVVITVLNRVNS